MGDKKKAQRATSSVFTMFDQHQVQEFKEAFSLMDQDRDGTISVDDLREVYSSLGKPCKDDELKKMIAEAPGAINFTLLLQMFGEKIGGTDPEDTLLNAFKLFDKVSTGKLHKDTLRQILTTEGVPKERMSDAEFNQMLEDAVPDRQGEIDYEKFTRVIKRGKEEENETK
ncbi:hypothetical protein SNEBB_006757 [Seison nebaliae]|nr:hypothetical protein SNEBB_006757 [Seison nebaliae]